MSEKGEGVECLSARTVRRPNLTAALVGADLIITGIEGVAVHFCSDLRNKGDYANSRAS
jgi:hypothetical protein